MRSRLLTIAHKEVLHIRRDRRSLIIILLLPLIMMVLYGYAITFDVKHINIAVIDRDKSPASRELVASFTGGGLFRVAAWPQEVREVERLMRRGKIHAALVIPRGYQRHLRTKPATAVELLLDGSNANTATIVLNYTRMLLANVCLATVPEVAVPFEVRPLVLYNPEQRSMVFVVPGLVAVLIMMICALLTSIAVSRERETGTMEQILVSPIHSLELVLGKVLPYVAVALLDATSVVVFSVLVFRIPFRGSAALLLGLSVFFVYASLSLGVLISSRATTQRAALMGAVIATLLPSILLSGFIFPIRSMPKALQVLTYLVPARYYLRIIRGIMLKGIGAVYLWQDVLWLFAFGTLLLTVSIGRFRTRLEG
ncbi:MAG: ABC transporter permease [Candidatus Oleimicrobiaceae bacterium]